MELTFTELRKTDGEAGNCGVSLAMVLSGILQRRERHQQRTFGLEGAFEESLL